MCPAPDGAGHGKYWKVTGWRCRRDHGVSGEPEVSSGLLDLLRT